MNWDALGASAELIAALGVIASLLYLARQIRQSNATDRLSATLALQEAYNQTVQFCFGHPESARVLRAGLDGLQELAEHERFQFSAQLYTLYGHVEIVFHQYKRGLVDFDLWNRARQLIIFYRSFPGVQQWWAGTDLLVPPDLPKFAARNAFSRQFQDLVDSIDAAA